MITQSVTYLVLNYYRRLKRFSTNFMARLIRRPSRVLNKRITKNAKDGKATTRATGDKLSLNSTTLSNYRNISRTRSANIIRVSLRVRNKVNYLRHTGSNFCLYEIYSTSNVTRTTNNRTNISMVFRRVRCDLQVIMFTLGQTTGNHDRVRCSVRIKMNEASLLMNFRQLLINTISINLIITLTRKRGVTSLTRTRLMNILDATRIKRRNGRVRSQMFFRSNLNSYFKINRLQSNLKTSGKNVLRILSTYQSRLVGSIRLRFNNSQ